MIRKKLGQADFFLFLLPWPTDWTKWAREKSAIQGINWPRSNHVQGNKAPQPKRLSFNMESQSGPFFLWNGSPIKGGTKMELHRELSYGISFFHQCMWGRGHFTVLGGPEGYQCIIITLKHLCMDCWLLYTCHVMNWTTRQIRWSSNKYSRTVCRIHYTGVLAYWNILIEHW